MNYLIIVLFLYCCNSLGMEEGEKKMELSQLTFSEIKNGFFEEIKKSKLKKLGLSLGSSILSFGLTALVNKKYQITKKQRMVGAVSFFLFPLSSQAAAYYYFGKHPDLKTFENSFLFREQYKDVLEKRKAKREEENENNFDNNSSNYDNFSKNKDRSKNTINKKNTDYSNFSKNSKTDDNNDDNNYYKNNNDNNNKSNSYYNHQYAYKIKTTAKEDKNPFPLELPPVPDEGIPGNEQGHLNKRKNDEEITPKTDDYFNFNIENLELNKYFSNNLSVLIFYLLEINEEQKLEEFAAKLINKIKKIIEEKSSLPYAKYIKQNILKYIKSAILITPSNINKYRQTYKSEKLIKLFIFPLLKNTKKNKALEYIHEFIAKNINNKNISDQVKKNTLRFIKKNNLSAGEIKANFLKNKNQHEQKKYQALLKKNFAWFKDA